MASLRLGRLTNGAGRLTGETMSVRRQETECAHEYPNQSETTKEDTP